MHARHAYTVLFFATLLVSGRVLGADLFPEETAFRITYDASFLSISGRVVDPFGSPLQGCSVSPASGIPALTGADGTFAISGLSRSNQLVSITRPGYYRQVLPVQLFVPLAETNLTLDPVVLWPESPSVVRFLFGGDTAFARRMLDPLERAPRDQMPMENPDALIRVSDPLPGTLGVVDFVKPFFLAADYPVVNFESVVTLDPSKPHLQKDFVYFTLPESLAALRSLNIDYVGLGNNHTYDYLESGVTNTCRYLAEAGLHFSGLGSNSAAAFAPYRTVLKGVPYSFLAMTSIGGERFVTNYVAGPDKGGAAYIESKEEARQAISSEKTSGQVTILQAHVGDEYTFEPSSFALNWMKFGVDSGADLVVSHHTHVAQGFSIYRGVLLVHCLGNLFFDQDRLETMVGLVATIDMEEGRLRRAWGTPVYLEDYRPRPIFGGVTPILCRRIGEFSRQLRAFPYNGQVWLATRPDQYSFEDRRLVVEVPLDTNGWTVLDLRDLATAEESLSRIETDMPDLVVRPGRDLLTFGDFEDIDVDADVGEASRWDFGSSTRVVLHNPRRGTAALGMQRSSSNLSDAVAAFRNRTRVMGDAHNVPNKALSLYGYMRAAGAGRIQIVARYYASEGVEEFGEELALDVPGGSFEWQPFMQDLHMPPDDPTRPGDPPAVNARAVRMFLRHSPPSADSGYVWFDELAVVNWEEPLDPLLAPALNTPHARDFLRVEGSPGTYRLALTFRRYRPIEADRGHGPDIVLESEAPDQSADHLWFPPTAVGVHDVLRLVVRNRGDQTLIVSNLSVITGNQTDFAARWLTTSGSSIYGVATIAPGAAACLEVSFNPAVSGLRQAVVQFDSNDPDKMPSPIQIAVSGNARSDTAVRSISGNRSRSPTVRLAMPSGITADNLLQEQLPDGLVPLNISNAGRWDTLSRTIEWQNVTPGSFVSYAVTGPENVYSIFGWVVAAGQVQATAGDETLAFLSPPDLDADGLPDWWELKFFDDRTAALAERDSDADGQSNLAEFLAETHPLDGGFQAQQLAPFLRLLAVTDDSDTVRILGFDGATYRLETSHDLATWQPIRTNLCSGESILIPRTNAPPTAAFYRAAEE